MPVFSMKSQAVELHFALQTNQFDLVAQLLRSGADPNAIYRGSTPLGHAVSSLKRSAVELLIKSGADPNLRSRGQNNRLEPPLFTACRLRSEELVRLLLDAGADVNTVDFYGHTPLWEATKQQCPLLVTLLLNIGAHVGSKIGWRWEQCPLYMTTKYLGYRGRRRLARMFLAAGTNPTLLDGKERNAIYWTLRNKDYDLFQLIIDNYNPSCWHTMTHPRFDSFLTELPENQQQYLREELFHPPSLLRQCRFQIREFLLDIHQHRSLFLCIPLLPLPNKLIRYLLLDEDLCTEETVL